MGDGGTDAAGSELMRYVPADASQAAAPSLMTTCARGAPICSTAPANSASAG